MKQYAKFMKWLEKQNLTIEKFPATDGGIVVFVKRDIMQKADDPYYKVRRYWERSIVPNLNDRKEVDLSSNYPYDWIAIHFANTEALNA